MYLLHGELELKIVEARLELDMEYFSEHGHHYLQYPYVKAYMGPARVARTNCASAESCNPVWNHLCKLPVAYSVYQVRILSAISGVILVIKKFNFYCKICVCMLFKITYQCCICHLFH